MLANTRSVVNKVNELHIELVNNNIQIIALCESWLNNSIPDAFINNCGEYIVYRKDRDSRGGGVCLLIAKSFSSITTRVILPNEYECLELLAVDINVDNINTRLILVYRPPGNTYDHFKNELLVNALQYLTDSCQRTIILGDFNLPMVDWRTCSYTSVPSCNMLCDYLLYNGLHQIIEFPTRGDNVLDLVFVNDPLLISDANVYPPISTSDHNSVILNFYFGNIDTAANLSDYNIDKESNKMYCFNQADWVSINEHLCSIDWLSTFKYCITVDDYWQCFHSIMITCLNNFVPTLSSTNCTMANKKRQKYPLHIRKLLNKKALAWSLSSKFKTPNLKMKYKTLAERCKNAINKFFVTSENSLIETENLGAFYKFVNNKTSTRAGVSPLYDNDGVLQCEDSKKADLLNSFFTSIFSVDNGIRPPMVGNPNSINASEGFCCSPRLVEKAILNMKNSKSAGEDKLPISVFKNLCRPLAIPLSIIFNISMSTSLLPKEWKSATIIPVFKKGSSSDPSNYRPISLTSTSCKILESLIKEHLLTHLLQNGLLSKQQHGFLSKCSTVTQLLDCCNYWMNHVKRNSQTDIVYLDFAKAFDSVVHSKLIFKLECYGVSGLILKWITDFLTGRTQRVKVGYSISQPSNVISGVPQGSVLGPILFLIFINDLCNLKNNDVNIKLFADDVKLYLAITDQPGSDKIQLHLDAISQWCNDWQLNLSPLKCAVLSLGHNPVQYHYRINNVIIQHVADFKDLGVIIDPLLSFEKHISEICSKANQRAALILKCFSSRDPQLLIRAFVVFVRPLLEYASAVWCPYKKFLIERIESVQRRFTKKLFGMSLFNYENRLIRLKIDCLEIRRLKTDLKLYYKIINNLVNINKSELFNFSVKRTTRGHNLKMYMPRCSTNFDLNKFCCRAIAAWNHLDPAVVYSVSVASFKRGIDSANLNKYKHL